MTTFKNFLASAWSRWYVRTAGIITGSLWLFACCWSWRLSSYFEWMTLIPPDAPVYSLKAFHDFRRLARLEEILDFAMIWLVLFALLCYIGFTAELAYKWLHKRVEAH